MPEDERAGCFLKGLGMAMVTVVARETFPYAGITRYRGDAFEASREDARILGLAQRVDLATVAPSPIIHTAEPAADEPRRQPRRRSREQADEA